MKRTDWQDALVLLTSTVVAATTIAFLYFGRPLLVPLALAIFATFVLSPVVNFLQRRGIPRTIATATVICLVAVGACSLLWLGGRQAALLARELPKHTANIREKVQSVKDWAASLSHGEFSEMLAEMKSIWKGRREEDSRPSADPKSEKTDGPIVITEAAAGDAAYDRLAQVAAWANPALEAFGNAALTLLLAAFMLIKREDMRNRLIKLIGPQKVARTTKAINEAGRRISRYLFMQAIVNGSYGVALAIGLWLLGAPFALLWGAAAAVLRYIPYVGPVLAAVPPIALSVALSDGWSQPLSVLCLFVALELVSNNVLEPLLYGQSMGVSETALIFAAAFWAFLWGPVGLVLSGSLTVILVVLGRSVPQLHFIAVLLQDDVPLDPHVSFYQRLLAQDYEDAADMASRHARERGLAAAFDELASPALSLAVKSAAAGELDADDLQFVAQSVETIIEDLPDSDKGPTDVQGEDADQTPLSLIVLPARDPMDEVGARMLRRLLPQRHWRVELAASDLLKSEMVASTFDSKPAMACVSSFTAGDAAHLRYICKRLRKENSELRLMVAWWGGKKEEADRLLDDVGADAVVHSFREALATVNGLHPVLAETADASREAASHR